MIERDSLLTSYHHTQSGPWWLLLLAVAATLFSAAWCVPGNLAATAILNGTACLLFILAAAFHHLTVADDGSSLDIHFGPIPLFRKRIAYADILAVEKGRTTLLTGWGIHVSPRGGWVWNIAGFDCVIIHLKKGIIRVGTNDPDSLVAFLKTRVDTNGDS